MNKVPIIPKLGEHLIVVAVHVSCSGGEKSEQGPEGHREFPTCVLGMEAGQHLDRSMIIASISRLFTPPLSLSLAA